MAGEKPDPSMLPGRSSSGSLGGSQSRATLGEDVAWRPPWLLATLSSHFWEGHKESCVYRLSPWDWGLQVSPGQGTPLLKHTTNFTPPEGVARQAISGA